MRDDERKLAVLVLADGKSPLEEWLRGLRDKPTRLKILRQIDKPRRDLGVQKSLKGIAELKIDLGPLASRPASMERDAARGRRGP